MTTTNSIIISIRLHMKVYYFLGSSNQLLLLSLHLGEAPFLKSNKIGIRISNNTQAGFIVC